MGDNWTIVDTIRRHTIWRFKQHFYSVKIRDRHHTSVNLNYLQRLIRNKVTAYDIEDA